MSRLVKRNDQDNRLGMRPIGKIKIGKQEPTKKNPDKLKPTSLDHFRIYADEPVRKAVHHALEVQSDEEITELDISFITDDNSKGCFHQLELRDRGGRLVMKGDGRIYKSRDFNTGNWIEFDIEYKDNQKKLDDMTAYWLGQGSNGWSERLTIRFVLRKYLELFGYWEFSTGGSKSSIPAIVDPYDAVYKLCQEKGLPFTLVPFKLVVEKVKSNNQILIGENMITPVFSSVYLEPKIGPNDFNDIYYLAQNNFAFQAMLDRDYIREALEKIQSQGPAELGPGVTDQ